MNSERNAKKPGIMLRNGGKKMYGKTKSEPAKKRILAGWVFMLVIGATGIISVLFMSSSATALPDSREAQPATVDYSGAVLLKGGKNMIFGGITSTEGDALSANDMTAYWQGDTLYASAVSPSSGNHIELIIEAYWYETSPSRNSDFYTLVLKAKCTPNPSDAAWKLEAHGIDGHHGAAQIVKVKMEPSGTYGSIRWDYCVPFQYYQLQPYKTTQIEEGYSVGLSSDGSYMNQLGGGQYGTATIQAKGNIDWYHRVSTTYTVTHYRWEVGVSSSSSEITWKYGLKVDNTSRESAYHEYMLVIQSERGKTVKINSIQFGGHFHKSSWWFDPLSYVSATLWNIELRPPPNIALTKPTSNTVWEIGKNYSIEWMVFNGRAPYRVNIYLSTTGGTANSYPIAIATNLQQSREGFGSYPWSVPNISQITPSATNRLKAEVIDSYGILTYSTTENFTIRAQRPAVSVLSPNGGEHWEVGKSYAIRWNIVGGIAPYNVKIRLSTDGGTSCAMEIGPGTNQSLEGPGEFVWTIRPLPNTTAARVNVVAIDTTGMQCEDWSDNDFAIQPQVPVVQVYGPMNGETVYVGTTVALSWSITGGVPPYTVSLKLSADGGRSFPYKILEGYEQQFAGKDAYAWTVNSAVPRSNAAVIEASIVDSNNQRNTAISSELFTIADKPFNVTLVSPNGGERFAPGENCNIVWYILGGSAPYSVSLYLSVDDGLTAPFGIGIINSQQLMGYNSYSWIVSNNPGTKARIKVVVTDATFAVVTDISDYSFTIGGQPANLPVVRLTAPNGFENLTAGTFYQITWELQGGAPPYTLSLYLYLNTGEIGASTLPIRIIEGLRQAHVGKGSYSWTVPRDSSSMLRSVTGYIKIEVTDSVEMKSIDISDNEFVINFPEKKGYLRGTIVDVHNNPIADAEVTVSGLGLTATTDTEGVFKLELPVGNYDLKVVKPGFNTARKYNLQVSASTTTDIGTVVLTQRSKSAVHQTGDTGPELSLTQLLVILFVVMGLIFALGAVLCARKKRCDKQQEKAAPNLSAGGDKLENHSLANIAKTPIENLQEQPHAHYDNRENCNTRSYADGSYYHATTYDTRSYATYQAEGWRIGW